MTTETTAAAATRPNPLRLNPLQLKTLAILQALVKVEGYAEAPDGQGNVTLLRLPHAHGDHVHVGDALVSAKDATGFGNPAVFGALERKGLVARGPQGGPVVTAAGLAYVTGVERQIFRGGHH